jgi:magnesium transporter
VSDTDPDGRDDDDLLPHADADDDDERGRGSSRKISTSEAIARAAELLDPTLFIAEFDFANKLERQIPMSMIKPSMKSGKFVWVDVDVANVEEARQNLTTLDLCAPEILEDALTRDPATQLSRYDDYIHIVMSGCRLQGDKFDLERVDVIVGESFMLTLHKGRPVFLEAVRRAYRADFLRFAKSPSFLLYELWDHLIDNYLSIQGRLELRVERIQAALIGEIDDSIFRQISELSVDLLELRKVVLPARTVLTDLSSRRSIFVSEATQPFLANMVGTLERVLQDVLVARDILSGSLDLYMSMVSHRTNRVMNRLTVVSVIFLPLTFLCGVYGMNFEILPETKWEHGYLFFWLMTGSIVGGLVWLLRRSKLL